nr:hypothetical protein CFP56_08477 [Quercus suber]
MRVPLPQSVADVEALACRRAVLFAVEIGLRKVIFEGDAAVVIQAINCGSAEFSSYGHIMDDITHHSSVLISSEFCFVNRCGLLNHSLRDCSEGQASGDKDGASHLQYGAWLRGEPMRRGGREVVTQGARREATEGKGAPEGSSTVPAEQRNTVNERNMVKESPDERGGHVDDKSNQEGSQSIGDVGVVTSVKALPEVLAENGKVKELVGKKEEKEAVLGRVGEEKLAAKTDFAEGMQWETALGQRSQLIFEGNLAPKNEVKMKVIGPAEENPIPGPLAMCYDEKKGWTSETLGPASRHWKRLAREINKGVFQESISPSNPKRVGPTPLQELDPNSACQKRRKGKNVGDKETNGESQVNRLGRGFSLRLCGQGRQGVESSLRKYGIRWGEIAGQ